MANSSSFQISKALSDNFTQYYKSLKSYQQIKQSALRAEMEQIDREYQREADFTDEHQAAKAANDRGDKNKLQNVTVPVIEPQVESSVEFLADVFLSGDSVFSVVASPKFADAALQMATVLQENAKHGSWARELILFFRDGRKYNRCALEVNWKRETTASIETDVGAKAGTSKIKEVIWSGNCIKRLDMYNTFYDTRVPPADVHKRGEFAGYTDLITRIELMQLIEDLGDDIIKPAVIPAYESNSSAISSNSADLMNYYIPQVAGNLVDAEAANTGTNWLSWSRSALANTRHIDFKDSYEKTVLYCRIVPKEFGLAAPKSGTPQIFKMIIINHSVLIHLSRLTNAHGYLPILIGQPNEDGLGHQTRSLAYKGIGFQNVASGLMTSIIDSRRRAISDRTLYDPSRVLSAHINSSNPSAKIPVKPSAYGSNISEAVYPFPYREDQAAFNVSHIQQIIEMSNLLAGQNKTSQGQFIKGNKLQDEFSAIMQNATGRDRLTAIMLEHQVFVPLKHMLKLNILQHQTTGVLYNEAVEQDVEIDPIKLRKAVVEFKVSDGVSPANKLMKGEVFSVALQQIGSSPMLSSGYNVPQMFSYLMKSQGAQLKEFEKSQQQMAYEQAVASWERTAALMIDKSEDGQPKLPPQPTPEQFGYQLKPQEKSPTLLEAVTPDKEQQQSQQQPQQQPQQ